MIKFGNISTLRLSLFSDESLVQEFAKILGFLRIQDLGVHCNNQGDFMKEVVSMWAPALQGLLTFRVFYEEYIILEENQEVGCCNLDTLFWLELLSR